MLTPLYIGRHLFHWCWCTPPDSSCVVWHSYLFLTPLCLTLLCSNCFLMWCQPHTEVSAKRCQLEKKWTLSAASTVDIKNIDKWISPCIPTRRFLHRCLDCFISAWILVPDKFSFSCQNLQCCKQDQMQDLSGQTTKEAGSLPILFTYKDQAFTNYVIKLSGG